MGACIHFTKAGVLQFGQHIFKCGLNHFGGSFPTRKAENGPTHVVGRVLELYLVVVVKCVAVLKVEVLLRYKSVTE